MKSMLIFKFPYASQYGGGEKHTLDVCDAVYGRGGRVFFVGSCSVLLQEFHKRGWPARKWYAGKEPVALWSLLVFPITAIFAWLGMLCILVAYRLHQKTTIVYCLTLTEKVLITPWARLLGMKVIWAEHVTPGRWLRLNPLRSLFILWAPLVTIVVISQNIYRQLRSLGVPASPITLVYNGINLEPYRDFQRRTFHWSKQFLVGTIGRLEPEKGQVYLLRAFQMFLSMVPHARLLFAGDGSQRGPLEWLARQLGIERSVQFVGFQPPEHIPRWLMSFDCFVLPSTVRESFGIVLLEALAAQCPVIASNLGGIPEIIQHNSNGLLVPPADTEALFQALLTVYQHPDGAQERSENGLQMVEERFSLPVMQQHMMELMGL